MISWDAPEAKTPREIRHGDQQLCSVGWRGGTRIAVELEEAISRLFWRHNGTETETAGSTAPADARKSKLSLTKLIHPLLNLIRKAFMHRHTLHSFLALSLTGAAISCGCVSSDTDQMQDQPPSKRVEIKDGAEKRETVDRKTVDRFTANWAERPRLGANEMIAKYGQPQEATSERLIWHNAGPFKRISVMNLETPHDFPLPHVDFLEHTITYNVPQEKVGDLIAFDASSTINRTVGELSARCDLEGHNVLTLNLDHDIVTGKKTVGEARKAFGDIVTEDVAGKHPAYVEALQFQPAKMSTAAFPDKPVIPGSPVRPGEGEAQLASSSDKMNEAEVLATVIAIDLNEVNAAAQAKMKKPSQPVMDYAKMLHEQHGANAGKTMKLGQQIGATPLVTPGVEQLQKQGAGELAAIVLLDGLQFEKAYIDAMIKGHVEALATIDNKLMKSATNEDLKKLLSETRAHIAAHLEKAREIQGGMGR
ncbi:MAG: DUF4142 domain-containing protein [Anaerolineae bacterium]|nr:DUF4142 domain-containing protein [Phycisphaerae bacterium]